MSATIKAVLLVNTKKHQKGEVVDVSAADLVAYPGYYKAVTDIEAEKQAAVDASGETSSERHHRMKAEFRAEAERSAQIQADLRLKAADADRKLAEEGVARAAAEQAKGEVARKLAETEAENVRLRQALAEQQRAEAKVIELRPRIEETAPADAPTDKPVPPHQRKREG